MSTLNQYSYDIFELARSVIVDDDSIDLRQIKFWISTQRALFLRNEYNKNNRSIDPNVIQDLGCVELEDADQSECCTIKSGCTIKRTKLEIPNPIELHASDLLTRVGPIKKIKSPFLRITFSRAEFVNNGRFNKFIIHWYYYNRRIYLVFHHDNLEAKVLKYINVAGVFENPEDVKPFTTCSGDTCYTDDMKYPINAWMYDYIKNAVIQTNLKMEMINNTDKANNASADAGSQQPVK